MSVNVKDSFVSTEMFRFKPASLFVERYHSVVSCALNMEMPFRAIFVNVVSK
jgi:hypothetical protein